MATNKTKTAHKPFTGVKSSQHFMQLFKNFMVHKTKTEQQDWQLIFSCWLIATISTLASLFFSEVIGLIPCELCWYQRIFMFPLVVILLAGLHPLDIKVVRYALPITIIGLLFTVYHCLLFFGVIPEALQPCRQGVSCSDDSMMLFGFLPIPLLSLGSFTIITILLLKLHTHQQQRVN